MRTVPALLVLLLLLSACGKQADAGDPGPGDSGLRGREFVSSAVTEGGKPYQLADGTKVRLNFTADGRLLADAGCNSMGGPVSVDGGRISVSELAMTGMGCPGTRMDQDGWLAKFLQGKPSWRFDGPALVVTGGSTEITLQDRRVTEPDLALVGQRWVVDTITDGEAASSVPAGAVASLTFAEGTVKVETGCNQGSGKYRISGNTISFDPIATTKKACQEDRMTLENAVLGVLTGQSTYEIKANRLTLKGSGGRGISLTAEK
jgi:heat shock protein HslJ